MLAFADREYICAAAWDSKGIERAIVQDMNTQLKKS